MESESKNTHVRYSESLSTGFPSSSYIFLNINILHYMKSPNVYTMDKYANAS
jgi:hypothetical protein